MTETQNGTTKLVQLYAIRFLILLAVAGLAGLGGYMLGHSPSRPAAAAAASSSRGNDSREAMARRNTVWRVWNGQAGSLPDTPERFLAATLGMILMPEAPVEARNAGMRAYLAKSAAYFSEEETNEIIRHLSEGTPQERAEAFRMIAARDSQATALIDQVLADRERVERFLAGLPIPLETMPDGSTP